MMPLADVENGPIYYEEYGTGPALILILGIGQDSATWGFQTPEFAKSFRTIVFDNRDSGRSFQALGPYTTKDMALDALQMMDFLGIDGAHILGTSMGGMIAQHIAMIAPNRVMRLLLVSTTSWGKD